MPNPYTPALISEFKTGISTYLQPWIRPQDAFEPLTNAYIYRGTVNKRAGSTQYGANLPVVLTITGISQAASAVVTADNQFTSDDYAVTEVTFSGVVGMTEINGLTGIVQSSTPTSFVVDIDSTAFTAYTSDGIAVYTPLTAVGDPVMGIMRWISGTTGLPSLLIGTTKNLYLYDAGSNSYNLVGNPPTFAGNITNFFNWTNWQPSDGADALLWMVNDKDPVTTFDGTDADQPVIAIDSSMSPVTITTALGVAVYKQRLLLIRPTLSSGGIQNQSIYWSAVQNPTSWEVDVAGKGGFLAAPTADVIVAVEFLRDVLVVFFSNSTWLFRFTGNASAPFQWDKVNNTKSNTAPYGTQAYDERATSLGNTGFVACDGVNVQRYDIPIIDYYETNISELYYAQAFSQRYENLNQTWLLYVSTETPFDLVDNVAPGSDSALIYNFLENTFSTYTFSMPLTCLGTFYSQEGTTWADLDQPWEDTDAAWNSYTTQQAAPILLAGGVDGRVWYMDNSDAVRDFVTPDDEGTAIEIDVVTTRWNPNLQLGQKVQFGYIDIYYRVVSTNPNDPIAVTLNFYVDNSNNIALSKTLTLDGPSNEIDNEIISVGTGISSYSGTVSEDRLIEPGSFQVTVTTSGGTETFTDNGEGELSGSLGGSGLINYSTTEWSIETGFDVPTGNDITASYTYYSQSYYNFKRIYINLIGEFIQMEIDPNVDSYMQFLGFILWTRPAGRLTP